MSPSKVIWPHDNPTRPMIQSYLFSVITIALVFWKHPLTILKLSTGKHNIIFSYINLISRTTIMVTIRVVRIIIIVVCDNNILRFGVILSHYRPASNHSDRQVRHLDFTKFSRSRNTIGCSIAPRPRGKSCTVVLIRRLTTPRSCVLRLSRETLIECGATGHASYIET